MTVRRTHARTPTLPTRSGPQPLTLRWFVIILAGIGSYLMGNAVDGPVGGIVLAVAVVGLLHTILE
jgi:hypothetical protein